jgi:SPP1 gp7 family putative phage head morphogenesis protein
MRRNTDPAHRRTDKELAALEKRIAAEYRKAAQELQEKINAYFERFKERDAEQKKRLEDGEITKQQYTQWRLVQIGRGKRFEALRDKIAERMTKANEVAAAYINDQTPGIYSLNRNYAAYTIEQQLGANVGFDLWDEQTVRRLIVEQPDLMPYYPPKRAVKRGIDLDWGKRQITAQVTSGILQGESIKHIADRLQDNIPNMNRTSAIRAARTAVTGAQNAGRLDSYQQAEAMGIQLEKQWLATLDDRTRHDHAVADGQTVPKDEPFIVGGEALMFPGDPSGSGWNIYNCRCTMIAKVKGVDMSNSLRRDRYGLLPNMTYAQWENTKRGEGALAAERYARKEAERETKDRKQYEEYKNILGENAPKSFTEFQNLKYNDNKWELFKAYERAIQTGELTTLTDFTLYQETSKEIDDKLVGLTTSNGITITGKSNHFIARVIGSVEQRRSGVDVDRVLEALTSKDAKILPTRVSPNGKISQRFIYEDIELSINPETGSLIQVNPYSRGRKS